MKILIVEDDLLTLEAIKKCIEELGHEANIARNGEEALELSIQKEFDLVISDIMMPGISGLSLVSVLRNILLFQKPIYLVSGMNDDLVKESSFSIGATGFITKPISIADIAIIINRSQIIFKN